MKLVTIMLTAMLYWSIGTRGQKLEFRELTPARGHYKQLSEFGAARIPGQEEVDKIKFPYDPSSTQSRLSITPYYLSEVTLEDFKMPDPPANSSEQTRAELNYLLSLQKQRTKLDVESSLFMAGVFYNIRVRPEDPSYPAFRKNLFHIGRSVGSWFNAEDLPLTANLIANVWRDASYFIWSMKFRYLRVRPYHLEQALDNLEDANWAAYPSGHSANSYINAYIYQELKPEFQDVFLKDAYDMAHSREILGVHYPSDSEASRIFARQFVNKLFTNNKFLSDFESVQKEWTEKAKESFIRPEMSIEKIKQPPPSCASTPTQCVKGN